MFLVLIELCVYSLIIINKTVEVCNWATACCTIVFYSLSSVYTIFSNIYWAVFSFHQRYKNDETFRQREGFIIRFRVQYIRTKLIRALLWYEISYFLLETTFLYLFYSGNWNPKYYILPLSKVANCELRELCIYITYLYYILPTNFS